MFCDGRYETVYPDDISRLALGPLATDEDRRAIIERFPTEILLVPADSPLAQWLDGRHDVAEVYCDGTSRIFLKRIDKFARWLSSLEGLPKPAADSVPARHVPFPG